MSPTTARRDAARPRRVAPSSSSATRRRRTPAACGSPGALAAEGFAVEIAAITGAGLPDRERDGDIEIRRYRPTGWSATMAATYRDPSATRRRRRGP